MMSTDDAAVVARLRAAGCVFAEDEARLLIEAAATGAELESLVAQRVSGTPLEYLVGWAEFRKLRVAVAPGVFVPRRRTALLVDEAVAAVTGRTEVVAVDLCCGSGALGMAFTTELEGIRVELVASDIEPAAVDCARRNLEPLGGRVYQGDLFAALPRELAGRIDILLANVPYVPTAAIADMPPEARDYEPRITLDGGDDGLAVFRRVAAAAPDWLAPGGKVFVEAGAAQVESAAAYLERCGLTARVAESDEYYATAVIGTRPNQ
ncbi:putative protein N(5)-glutamine methyltransferase [Nocardia arthritidis]|uniref:peptide chain release factor N(5)-glutamine methyltransferase n=1 Tax=Nocardia arthritidis TaxID=228602 RepID=A0A6G9YJL7_9NOCA|nr:putative protein N(5)-glutamine methyltransferase [Nocardia arthritidis]